MPRDKQEPLPFTAMNDPPQITDHVLKTLVKSTLGAPFEEYLIAFCENNEKPSETA